MDEWMNEWMAHLSLGNAFDCAVYPGCLRATEGRIISSLIALTTPKFEQENNIRKLNVIIL